ncbi:MAG: ribonuclease III domain-containing protein, partial [Bacteroidales bacterium]|nr:ribonuclease III domain-containing protein [Bacteroidales bacterium]
MPRSLRHFNLAFIHKSVGLANSASAHAKNNERLEYLGDAILEAVVSDILYHRFPDEQEGYLSKLRS